MESQPQNPEFRINPEKLSPTKFKTKWSEDHFTLTNTVDHAGSSSRSSLFVKEPVQAFPIHKGLMSGQFSSLVRKDLRVSPVKCF